MKNFLSKLFSTYWVSMITWASLLVFIILYLFVGCNGCNKKKQSSQSVVEVIEKTTKPLEDSLRKEVSALKDSISVLKKAMQKAANEKQVAKGKGTSTIAAREKAKEKKDTIMQNALCDQLEEDYRIFAEAVEREDSAQNEIIIDQNTVIEKQTMDIELQKIKFEQVKVAYDEQRNALDQQSMQLEKKERKLKRAKFLNKTIGIGAAVAAALLLL